MKHTRIKYLISLFLFCLPTFADGTECFEYEGTTIVGLTAYGQSTGALTIPSTVTSVSANAFSGAHATALVISDANVDFHEDAFDGMTSQFTEIHMGKNMSAVNMTKLLNSLGTTYFTADGTIVIEGLDGCAGGNINLADAATYLTGERVVILPAGLVRDHDDDNFNFGGAQVYGRFSLNNDLATFSGNSTFQDTDNGSNMLFYVATNVNENSIHLKRVNYVREGEGVLIHNAQSTSSVADIPRRSGTTSTDDERYGANLLVGKPNGGEITATETIGGVGYTNFVLYNGTFYLTQNGTLGANRAYLRILTSDWNSIVNSSPSMSKLSIMFDDDDTTAIQSPDVHPQSEIPAESQVNQSLPMYNVSGQRVNSMYKGIVIQGVKKYLAR